MQRSTMAADGSSGADLGALDTEALTGFFEVAGGLFADPDQPGEAAPESAAAAPGTWVRAQAAA